MKIFEKDAKKVTVKMKYNEGEIRGSATSVPLKDGQLIKHLKEKIERHGEIVITKITNDEIYLTTAQYIKRENFESRLDEINDLIRNYTQSKVSEMDAYLVLAKGEFKGIFGSETHSRLKKSGLIKKGFKEEEIEIKPIKVEDFSY